MKTFAFLVVTTCALTASFADAAPESAAEGKALAVAEATCASKGIKHSLQPPDISLSGSRWMVSWAYDKELNQGVVVFIDGRSWKPEGCVPISLWIGPLPNTKPL